MVGFVVSLFVGILCITLGISHTKGNLSSLHAYHRKRVREEDKLPFGRLVGAGTILIGIALIIFGGLSMVTELTKNETYMVIGTVVLIANLVVGMGLSFFGMIKYNKGIF